MQGRRIPVEEGLYFPEGRVSQPGDYYGPVSDPKYYNGRPTVWFILPIERDKDHDAVRCVVSPPHKFTEHPDGTLTIRESILAKGWDGEPDRWHGYLTSGNWESC